MSHTHTVGFTNSARYRVLEDLQKDSVDLCLTYCGLEYCNPSHRFEPNMRDAHVIHVIREGKGTLEINKKKYELGAGDVFYIPPKAEAWYESDKDDPWCYTWVGFVGMKAEECTSQAGFSLKNPVRKVNCVDTVSQYIEQMLEAYQLSYANELKRNGLLHMVMSAFVEDYCQNNAALGVAATHPYPGAVYVKHAVEYMTYHYDEKLKINDLADFIGINRSYLTSSFKKHMGCSPQEFLINLRMEKAKSLLKKTEMSINAVANAVGYPDQLAFSKVFKQHCGMSPRMYKEEKSELVIKKAKYEYTGSHL
nr:AraC family transcriptional regulator [uncultured Blautia sp.]